MAKNALVLLVKTLYFLEIAVKKGITEEIFRMTRQLSLILAVFR